MAHSRELRERARSIFLLGRNILEIQRELSAEGAEVSHKTLSRWARVGKWADDRTKVEEEERKKADQAVRDERERLRQDALEVVRATLDGLKRAAKMPRIHRVPKIENGLPVRDEKGRIRTEQKLLTPAARTFVSIQNALERAWAVGQQALGMDKPDEDGPRIVEIRFAGADQIPAYRPPDDDGVEEPAEEVEQGGGLLPPG